MSTIQIESERSDKKSKNTINSKIFNSKKNSLINNQKVNYQKRVKKMMNIYRMLHFLSLIHLILTPYMKIYLINQMKTMILFMNQHFKMQRKI